MSWDARGQAQILSDTLSYANWISHAKENGGTATPTKDTSVAW